jgi:lysophospholipase L1-like esterase
MISHTQSETPKKAQPTPTATPRRGRLSNIMLLLFSLLFTLGVCEIVLRVFHPLVDPYWRHKTQPANVNTYIPSQFAPGFSLGLRTEEGLPGTDRQLTFSVNNVGFRGDSLPMPKPAGEFRVFVVGGSTTECLYLDDSDAFTRVIQDSLARYRPGRSIKVYGAGKSGDKSYDHVAMVGHRIAHLQPDLIIVFAGINDLLASVNGRDYLFFADNIAPDDLGWDLPQLLRFTVTEFQVGRLLFGVLKPRTFREAAEEVRMESDIAGAAERRRSLPVTSEPPRRQLGLYEENLRSIIAMGRAHGAQVAFITQATSWNSTIDPVIEQWHWMNIGTDVSYPEPVMDAAMESYNDTVRRLGGALAAPVFDLARMLPKSHHYFYDDVHFNIRGAAVAGGALARFLADSDVIPQ